MCQPPGFSNADRNLVWKFQKSIRALKQAPRTTYER